MSKALRISPELSLPFDMATQTCAILAKRRVGKTYTASVLAEEFAKHGQPFVVLDPTGAWWGLRSSADGLRAGYPVLIIGGAHGDVPLEATAGKVIADLVVDHPGFYVIDLSGFMSNGEQDRFACDFAERLFRRKQSAKFPLHLIVDEADAFMPQRVQPNQARMLGAFEALTRRGGIHGIGMTVITHRPAVLNKNVLTQCELLVILQIVSPQDRTAILDYVKGHGTKEQVDTLAREMASLGKGDAYVWSPAWLDVFKKIHIRERGTFNSSATPKVGEKRIEPTAAAPVDLDKLKTHIAATIEKAKSDDPALLRKRIAELEKAQRSGPAVTSAPAGPSLKERIAEKAAERKSGWEDGWRVGYGKGRGDAINSFLKNVSPIHAQLRAMPEALIQIAQHAAAKGDEQSLKYPLRTISKPTSEPKPPAEVHVTFTHDERVHQNIDGVHVVGPELRIVDAIAWFEAIGVKPANQAGVAFLAGYSGSSNSAYKNPRARLKARALVEYHDGDRISLTTAGARFASADAKESSGTTAELHRRVLGKLGGPEQKILKPLLESYPEPIDNDTLAQKANYSDGSNSAYKNPRARLRSFGLVDYINGGVVAADFLFLDR